MQNPNPGMRLVQQIKTLSIRELIVSLIAQLILKKVDDD